MEYTYETLKASKPLPGPALACMRCFTSAWWMVRGTDSSNPKKAISQMIHLSGETSHSYWVYHFHEMLAGLSPPMVCRDRNAHQNRKLSSVDMVWTRMFSAWKQEVTISDTHFLKSILFLWTFGMPLAHCPIMSWFILWIKKDFHCHT